MPALADTLAELPSDMSVWRTFNQGSTGVFFLYGPPTSASPHLVRVIVDESSLGTLEFRVEETASVGAIPVGADELIGADGATFWSWPFGGAPSSRGLPVERHEPSPFVGVGGARGRDGRFYLAVTSGETLDLFVLDPSLARVEARHQTPAADTPRFLMDPLADGVVLVIERSRQPWEVHRASVSALSRWLTLPAEATLYSYVVATAVIDEGVGILLAGNEGFALGRVRLDRPELEGGFRSFLSGPCTRASLSGPPSGGALMVSACVEVTSIDFTYACVPDVLRE